MHYDIKILELLKMLSEDDFIELCFIHFREVYNNFTASQTRRQRMIKLIEYAEQHEQSDKLLETIKIIIPEKSKKIELYLSENNQKIPKLNPFIADTLFDRDWQEAHFFVCFKENFDKNPRQPQMYFIHGEKNEGHESFVKRMLNIHVKKYVQEKWGKEKAHIVKKNVSWPRSDNLKECKRIFPNYLFKDLEKEGYILNSEGTSAINLSKLDCFTPHSVVSITHNINISKWDKQNQELIKWYVQEYWGNLVIDDTIPLFLIFFNIIYIKPQIWKQWLSFWNKFKKSYASTQLKKLHKILGDVSLCSLIDELTSLYKEDVEEWIRNNIAYQDESQCVEIANSIFRKDSDSVCYLDVQHRFKMIIEKHNLI